MTLREYENKIESLDIYREYLITSIANSDCVFNEKDMEDDTIEELEQEMEELNIYNKYRDEDD